jgi:DNA-binding transcriptional LysR family regulator
VTLAKTASFRQLVTFASVARHGSVTLAADELHLSQSAVSIQIAALEESAGAPLVERTGRGVRLTEAGELLRGYVERMLALWQETNDEMALFLGAFSGSLRVGAVTTAEYWLPRLLVRFVNDHPKVKLKFHVGNRDEIVRSLATHEIDIAVMGRPPEELNVVAAPIAKNPMGFVAAPRHPLMQRTDLSLAEVAEARLLVRERGSGSRGTLERIFKEAGLRLRIGSELASNESIKQMCAAGFAPAYLSIHACELELRTGLLGLLPVPNNPMQREWYVVRLASRQMSQVAQAFDLFLRANAERELQTPLLPVWTTAAANASAIKEG